jgi:conjugative transfer signal peptidase TraF
VQNNKFLCALFLAGAVFVGAAKLLGPRVVIQVTPSMPRGVYWLDASREIARGDIIVFDAPAGARRLISERDWWRFSVGYVLMKPVVARKADRVRVSSRGLFINGALFGAVDRFDSEGLPLPLREIDTVLSEQEYFTASSYEHSFDSRYFGVIRREAIKGVARRIL